MTKGRDYTTEKVERGDLTQTVTATGTLNPVVNVTVGSQVSGRICKLNVDFNSMVKSNQVIAEIDPSTYQAAFEQAKADLANAKANAELQSVEAKRSSELFKDKLISSSDYDTAIATLHEAEATVQIKEASLHNAEANLGYCKILSPVDGVVISRAVELGQTVASSFSTPTLFQIANDLTKMQIDTAVDEADIGGVKKGESVDFTVGAYPNRTFHGVITQVRNAPTTVNNVVTYDTVIGVTNSDYSLKPGMTASVSIVVARHNQVLEIPNSALRFQPLDMAAVETNTLAAGVGQNANTQPRRKAGPPRGQAWWPGRQRTSRTSRRSYRLCVERRCRGQRSQTGSRASHDRHHRQYSYRSAVGIEGRGPGRHRSGHSRAGPRAGNTQSVRLQPSLLTLRTRQCCERHLNQTTMFKEFLRPVDCTA